MNQKVVILFLILFSLKDLIIFGQSHDSSKPAIHSVQADSLTPAPNVYKYDPSADISAMQLFFLLILLGIFFLGIILTLLFLLVIFALVSFGVLSTSIIVGLYKKSFTKGFRIFLILASAIAGAFAGIFSFLIIHLTAHLWTIGSSIISGTISGILGGTAFGLLVFYLIGKLVPYIKQKLNLPN
jgi:hypothetical protein